MAATGVQMNWTAVGFTPGGGSLTTIKRVNSVDFDYGGSLLPYSGDGDRYPTVLANNMNRPKANVHTADHASTMAMTPGTSGVFTARAEDALGATAGAVVYTLINAVVSNSTAGGQHSQYGAGTLSFESFSSDGFTNPLSFARS